MNKLFVIVDMVNGFINFGNLADKNINRIVPNIVQLLRVSLENDVKVVVFKDTHKINDIEFETYPPHCIKGSDECELIPELKLFESDMILIEKDTVDGFNTQEFNELISKEYFDKIIVCGCCTDICVQSFCKSLKKHLIAKNLKTEITVVEDAVDTFSIDGHDADIVNEKTLDDLRENYKINICKTANAEKILTKRIGAFVGKFLPPHIGHISIINRVLQECDEAVVVISDNPKHSQEICKNANFPYFSSKTRLKWLKKHYFSNPRVKFYEIDESLLTKTPFDYYEYSELFWNIVKENVNLKYADESYRELNEKAFSACKFVAIDRDNINIHGTDIRENFSKNIDYVIEPARKDILEAMGSIRSNNG